MVPVCTGISRDLVPYIEKEPYYGPFSYVRNVPKKTLQAMAVDADSAVRLAL
jgi:hypothetical protein